MLNDNNPAPPSTNRARCESAATEKLVAILPLPLHINHEHVMSLQGQTIVQGAYMEKWQLYARVFPMYQFMDHIIF